MLYRKLLWFGCGFGAFCLFTGALALAVTYKPYGVPDNRRDEYESLVEKAKVRNELVMKADELDNPLASFNKTTHDFGLLDPHTTNSYDFRVTNKGNGPLTLDIRETSCKCTVGKLGGNILLPGEKTIVTLTWNTGKQAESYEQVAIIETNDPVTPIHELRVKGVVKAEVVMPEEVAFTKQSVGEVAKASFNVYSQLWDDFEITNVEFFSATGDSVEDFFWVTNPASTSDPELAEASPKSAWTVELTHTVLKHKGYQGRVVVTMAPSSGAESVNRAVSYVGSVRPPISFFSPVIDSRSGLDVGTLNSGEEHQFYVTVRANGDPDRKLEVLEISPPELLTTLTPTKVRGDHRLEIKVPADCPMIMFNRGDKHGFVHVGDPEDESFDGWFPLVGAVVKID